MSSKIRLSCLVIHWRDEESLEHLLHQWPEVPSAELIVIDNSGTGKRPSCSAVLWVIPPNNLGFAGGVNLGVQIANGDLILILNPDAMPEPGALESLIAAADSQPGVDGFAPRLLGKDGEPQDSWQLRPLPRPSQLLMHALLIDPVRGPVAEPNAGTVVEQPAAAALLLRRTALDSVAGLDPRFRPAWFEDVDLAKRLRMDNRTLVYWPHAVFTHGLGGSVDSLGYGPFLVAYYRNLKRYLDLHARRPWGLLLTPVLILGMSLRLLLLPFRKPRRASSRTAAARGLAAVISSALINWRRVE